MRRKTRTINVGGVRIGSGYPVRIQSMTKTDTRDVRRTIVELRELEMVGCEVARVAVKDSEAAGAIKAIKRKIKMPLVADIHFDYRLALESIKNGADKIRINPGNITDEAQLKEIIKAAKKRRIPIRIGLNSGSLNRFHIRDFAANFENGSKHGSITKIKNQKSNIKNRESVFVKTALKYIKLFEKESFRDIIISLKSSSVPETVSAYKRLAVLCDYPFHLGVTAAGSYDTGIVKSSIGIGSLLLDGIGDTIRVSLTADPKEEVIAAKRILQAVGSRKFGPEVISCPTCGRCQVDLVKIVKEVESALNRFHICGKAANSESGSMAICGKAANSESGSMTIAIMGCEVNGPGEAKEADAGIAFGKGFGMLFKKGKIIKKIKTKDAVKELLKTIGYRPSAID